MIKRPKIWKSLSQLALAGTASIALLGGCESFSLGSGEGGEGEGKPRTSNAGTAGNTLAMDHSGEGDEGSPMKMAPASGEGAGEGEGGAAKSADLKTDNVAYLTELSLIKGHLLVGVELYRQGAFDMADVHMKHPHDELIKGLDPAFAARGTPGFDKELGALGDAVKARASVGDVNMAYKALVAAIDKSELAGTGKSLSDAKQVVALVEQLVRVAASEYAQGVVDGKVVMPKEYQDAYGFTQVAKQRLAALAASNTADADARHKVEAQLDSLAPAWPAIVPPPAVKADASLLYGAAARIQIAGLSI